MTDYTPGPWHYATKGPGLLGVFCGDGRFARPGDLIAGVAASDNHEANARLIAAAPDLLAALEIIAGMCCIEHAQDEARNAIAMARGEG